MVDSLKIIRKGFGIFSLIVLFISIQTLENSALAQSNRRGKKNNFSNVGKHFTYIRHGLTFHLGGGISARLKQSVSAVPMIGLGYVASQYYGVGNRFMQQSVTYQFGIGLGGSGFQTHNVTGTFHCSYIGGLDLNPFVYGIALHYLYATPEVSKGTAYSNFYVRPEIGIAFPAQYSDRTKSIQRVTAMITYGFNIRTFYNYNPDMEAKKEEYKDTDPKDIKYPWAAMNHHVVTIRLNINLGNIQEMRR
ncbi:MAG: hypothetical protein LBL13_02320 [Bacteroidales bacterium]|jgi:hypothetical protein|nr:hypothetical protein [Bacteroidales bacterium]